ncbi:sigma-E processing peptidase SpoIIGA [Bacillus infantis]|uniref:sigma-E processing peptidase SpoIIGA n=1 Tax=Bacillus infantis TaxID=324767 RepID=UPI003CE691A3
MAIYLDIIWLLNFLFDSLLLYLTAIFLKRDVSIWRILAGGAAGSMIVLLAVTPVQSISGHPLSKLLFSIVMVVLAFGYKRAGYFIKGLFTFYMATFLIGGTLIGAHYFVKFDFELSSAVLLGSVKGFGDPISWMFVIFGFPAAWHFSRKHGENMEMANIQYDQLAEVCISINEIDLNFKGLVDTGNQLYDPISRTPVMIASLKGMAEKLPEVLLAVSQDPEPFLMGEARIPPEWENRMRILPCKVVGQEHQLIIAMKPDRIIIQRGEEKILAGKALISFTMQQLSSDDAFDCIIHPKMMTGAGKAESAEKVS